MAYIIYCEKCGEESLGMYHKQRLMKDKGRKVLEIETVCCLKCDCLVNTDKWVKLKEVQPNRIKIPKVIGWLLRSIPIKVIVFVNKYMLWGWYINLPEGYEEEPPEIVESIVTQFEKKSGMELDREGDEDFFEFMKRVLVAL